MSAASHEKVVELIRKSGDLVQMTVVSVGSPTGLPSSKSTVNIAGAPPGRGYATLPRKLTNGPLANTLGSSFFFFFNLMESEAENHKNIDVFFAGRSAAPLPPRRDPKTTLSVGRARAKSMVATVGADEDIENNMNCSSVESIHQQESGKKGSSMMVIRKIEWRKKSGGKKKRR